MRQSRPFDLEGPDVNFENWLKVLAGVGTIGSLKRTGDALRANASPGELQFAAPAVAHAGRESLHKSWGIGAWSAPDEAASSPKRVP
jgi:hypothetical protein